MLREKTNEKCMDKSVFRNGKIQRIMITEKREFSTFKRAKNNYDNFHGANK